MNKLIHQLVKCDHLIIKDNIIDLEYSGVGFNSKLNSLKSLLIPLKKHAVIEYDMTNGSDDVKITLSIDVENITQSIKFIKMLNSVLKLRYTHLLLNSYNEYLSNWRQNSFLPEICAKKFANFVTESVYTKYNHIRDKDAKLIAWFLAVQESLENILSVYKTLDNTNIKAKDSIIIKMPAPIYIDIFSDNIV